MEIREAKKMLQARLECMKQEDLSAIGKGCDKKCDECHLNYEQGNRGEQKEAISVGIATLEKQTAIPLKEKVDGFWGDRTMVCPTCGCGAVVNLMRKEPELYPYCPWCGQKLKGEDENEKDEKSQKQN